MTLKRIKIENIKGIELKSFELDIIPNKPSLLIAPNGFGKSSISCAFGSMSRNRINLKDEDYYCGNQENQPSITIDYQRTDGVIVTLLADEQSNSIASEIDFFVIKNSLSAKGSSTYFGNTSVKMIIDPVILVDSIPVSTRFDNYSLNEFKLKFGINNKVLPNPNIALKNKLLVEILSENYTSLQRANGVRVTESIQLIINQIQQRNGTKTQICNWINEEYIDKLKGVNHLSDIAHVLGHFELDYTTEAENFLLAIQLVWLYNKDRNHFKKACNYNNYVKDKDDFNVILSNFNTTWRNIRTKQSGGKLVLTFPRADEISNGQRDILSFLAMLFRAKSKLIKNTSVLVIDEVFDYLDDANLVAAQYYITQFIQTYKEKGKRIYPLILTHLNPQYFKNYTFSNQKNYYLNKSNIHVNPHMKRLLMCRKNELIENFVSTKIFHFHPGQDDMRIEFRDLRLPELWGVGRNFKDYTLLQLTNYLKGDDFDPFAVCCAVRVKIEEITYLKIQGEINQEDYLLTHMTRPKLEMAKNLGYRSPETFYLLGIIYNDGLHWNNNQDNISPIASKLENLTIKKLISEVFKEEDV